MYKEVQHLDSAQLGGAVYCSFCDLVLANSFVSCSVNSGKFYGNSSCLGVDEDVDCCLLKDSY